VSIEENKAIVRRFRDECWLAGRLEVADEILAETVTRNGEAVGREGMKRFIAAARAALPDFQSETEELIAEGDQVAWLYTSRGTHTGAPLFGVAPTGKALTIAGTAIVRLSEGRIVDIRDRANLLPVHQELGLVTPSGPSVSPDRP
jgi:predicted ester cyclase